MRHYEIVLLVHPDQSDQLPGMVTRYQDMVKKNKGTIHRVEDIGRLQLAYTINDMHKAHYVLLNIECNGQTLSEIESSFVFNDSIMRHLVIRMGRAETDPSKLFLLHNKNKKHNKVELKDEAKVTSENVVEKKSSESIDQENEQDLDIQSETESDKTDAKLPEVHVKEKSDEKD